MLFLYFNSKCIFYVKLKKNYFDFINWKYFCKSCVCSSILIVVVFSLRGRKKFIFYDRDFTIVVESVIYSDIIGKVCYLYRNLLWIWGIWDVFVKK